MKVDEIQKRYNITANDLEEIKFELKKRIKESHPDNNNDFNSDYFTKLKEDLDYVESLLKKSESDGVLIPINEVTQIIKEILQVQIPKDVEPKKKLEMELSVSVENQILTIKKRRRIYKYSSASILAIITFLWMFPNEILQHPLIQMFFRHPSSGAFAMIITIIWLYALMITSVLWFNAVREERIEKEIVDRVKLESVQDRIFMNFLNEILPEKQFTKLDFMKYLSNGINIVGEMKVKKSFIRRFHLEEEVIQNMADIILLRAKEYEIIKAIKPHGLIECYEIILQDE